MLRAALANSGSRRFFAAHAQSCVGTGLAYVALPLLAYDRFGSAWAVAGVLLPELLPAILLGPLLGALIDRFGWRASATLADVARCLAFAVMPYVTSLPAMVAAATLAGIGSALFAPAALAGLPQLVRGDGRPAAMGLFGALDDVGQTLGPAAAGLLLALTGTSALLLANAATFGISGALIATLPALPEACGASAVQAPRSLLAEARAGVREVAARPEVRALIASSAAAVVCIGMTNVGEVVLARQTLGVGGSGLAAFMTAGGVGTVLGSLAGRFRSPWQWRRAYLVGLGCMAVDLLCCAFVPSFWLLLPVLALGGFGNGFALMHDRLLLSDATPESLHGRLFAVQKTCTSLAFAVSFMGAGALIAGAGIRTAFFCAGCGLILVAAVATPRLRAAWPAPGGDALALGATRAR
jgi:MFS family permease